MKTLREEYIQLIQDKNTSINELLIFIDKCIFYIDEIVALHASDNK